MSCNEMRLDWDPHITHYEWELYLDHEAVEWLDELATVGELSAAAIVEYLIQRGILSASAGPAGLALAAIVFAYVFTIQAFDNGCGVKITSYQLWTIPSPGALTIESQ